MKTLPSRAMLAVGGTDAAAFLQGLLSNDVLKLAAGGVAYAALLTPQGKYAYDMFVHKTADGFLLDVARASADALFATLKRYRLRSHVELQLRDDLHVAIGADSLPADPRLAALGTRGITHTHAEDGEAEYTKLRLRHGVLEGAEIPSDRAFILDYGFEELHGVDFNKGCYVGQEITARMHFKAIAKKGLYTISAAEPLAVGDVITSNGEAVGEILAASGEYAVAILRHEAASGTLLARGFEVRATRPMWAKTPVQPSENKLY